MPFNAYWSTANGIEDYFCNVANYTNDDYKYDFCDFPKIVKGWSTNEEDRLAGLDDCEYFQQVFSPRIYHLYCFV